MAARVGGSVVAEAFVAQQLQPVAMGLAEQQLGGALACPLRSIAAQEAAMVEEKAQQVQVVVADVATQEEVISQAAVEILDDGTGTGRLAVPAAAENA